MKKRTVRGKRTTKKRTQPQIESEKLINAPHSFVFHKGNVGPYIHRLAKDFRKVMAPFTASSLKARKKNRLRDFISVAGALHVSHFCIFTHTEVGTYLKIAKTPRGPTMTFKIHNYILSRDVISSLKKQYLLNKSFQNSPLMVLNNFTDTELSMKMLVTMFSNMFPTINITDVKLSNIRRCVLLNYDPITKLIEFRHYAIKVNPVGISKGVKKMVQNKVPNLARYDEISDFLTKPEPMSESEFEDVNAEVVLPQKINSRGSLIANSSAIKLIEIGPRMTLQLLKIEEELLSGQILFHELVQKTDEEIKATELKRKKNKQLKAKRKMIQEKNTIKKKNLKENEKIMREAVRVANEENPASDDDDVAWYRKEVGQEPDQELFKNKGLKRKSQTLPTYFKRKKTEDKKEEKNNSRDFNNSRDYNNKSNKFNKSNDYNNKSNKFNDSRDYNNKSNKFNNSRDNNNKSNKFNDSRDYNNKSNKFNNSRDNNNKSNKFNNSRDYNNKSNKFNNSRDNNNKSNKFNDSKNFKNSKTFKNKKVISKKSNLSHNFKNKKNSYKKK